MPWHVMKSEQCPVSKPWAVMKDEPHEVVACHETEEDAQAQLTALNIAYTEESRAAKYDHIDFTPPSGVREAAKKGLEWRREYGRGGTAIGVARARDLSNGVTISPQTARRMKAYFDRHEVDKQGEGWNPGEPGFPSAGKVAWYLWGSDEGWSWSKKLVKQINAADEEERTMILETRSIAVDESDLPLLCIEERAMDGGEDEDRKKKKYIVGYAARFGTNSLDLGDFVERIEPTAFDLVRERRGRKKPLETRALWNHDPNFPLARYPQTLSLTVDEVGLRYEFPVPDTTYGRDIAANIEAGIVKGSSFSFVVSKDGESWSVEDGQSIRTISKIETLYDVGPVTYPAYPDSAVTVAKRSYELFRDSQIANDQRRGEWRQKIEEHREWLRQYGG